MKSFGHEGPPSEKGGRSRHRTNGTAISNGGCSPNGPNPSPASAASSSLESMERRRTLMRAVEGGCLQALLGWHQESASPRTATSGASRRPHADSAGGATKRTASSGGQPQMTVGFDVDSPEPRRRRNFDDMLVEEAQSAAARTGAALASSSEGFPGSVRSLVTLLVFLVSCYACVSIPVSTNALSHDRKGSADDTTLDSRPQTSKYSTGAGPPSTPWRSAATATNFDDETPTTSAADITRHEVLEDYIKRHGGDLIIRRILIANNGMAAAKAILSMRSWAYHHFGDERAIEFIAMASPEDMHANSEYIRMVDTVVSVPGGSNKFNYANVDLIVEIARKKEVDAVWPGWGHASENPKLPATLARLGITFIGPSAPVMAALGDKIAANILAQTAGVPSIRWSGDGLSASLSVGQSISKDVFDAATIKSYEDCLAHAQRVGYPLMLKASEGGGGKGIRLVTSEDQLPGALQHVRDEVPGSPVFLMQVARNARHIEVQIVGDKYQSAVALSGRDCTTQRRFQKIFEEGPPTIVPPHVFREMEKAAQRLTQSIAYEGAGTVEFLYSAKDQKFFFLELNPRLQVEHPVTELITNVNLPAVQLQVAMGVPLHRIPEIRYLYGKDAEGTSAIDFFSEPTVPFTRHVIAARITAENPDEGFKPTSGLVERIQFQSTPSVWGYFSVGVNGGVHEYADSQFGHVFASGKDREEARKSLVLALRRLTIRGKVRTTVEYLVDLLNSPAFIKNTIDTSWLDGIIKQQAAAAEISQVKPAAFQDVSTLSSANSLADNLRSAQADRDVVIAGAVVKAKKKMDLAAASLLDLLNRGRGHLPDIETWVRQDVEVFWKGFKFAFDVIRIGGDWLRLTLNGGSFEVRLREQLDGTILASWDGASHVIHPVEEPLGLRLEIDGSTKILPAVHDPSELRSDVNGKLLRFVVPDGALLRRGDAYAEVESMKMVMTLQAREAGKISHRKPPNSIISVGDILATLDLSVTPDGEASAAGTQSRFVPFTETFILKDVYTGLAKRDLYETAALRLRLAALGFNHPTYASVAEISEPPTNIDWSTAHDLPPEDVVAEILQQFATIEQIFAGRSSEEAVLESSRNPEALVGIFAPFSLVPTSAEKSLSLLFPHSLLPSLEPLRNVLVLYFAHHRLAQRTVVVKTLLENLDQLPQCALFHRLPATIETALVSLSALQSDGGNWRREHAAAAIAASRSITNSRRPPAYKAVENLRNMLESTKSAVEDDGSSIGRSYETTTSPAAADATTPVGGVLPPSRTQLTEVSGTALELLPSLFWDNKDSVRQVAVETYIRRVYALHEIENLRTTTKGAGDGVGLTYWDFYAADVPRDQALRRRAVLITAPDLDSLRHVGNVRDVIEHMSHPYSKTTDPGATTSPPSGPVAAVNTVHVVLAQMEAANADVHVEEFERLLASWKSRLVFGGVRSLHLSVLQDHTVSTSYLFTHELNYTEDKRARGMAPSMVDFLELPSLRDLTGEDLLRVDHNMNATCKAFLGQHASYAHSSSGRNAQHPMAVYLRAAAFRSDYLSAPSSALTADFIDLLGDLRTGMADARVPATAVGRIFLHLITPLDPPPPLRKKEPDMCSLSDADLSAEEALWIELVREVAKMFDNTLIDLREHHSAVLLQLGVDSIELKFRVPIGCDAPRVSRIPIRLAATTEHGGSWLSRGTPHAEVRDQLTGKITQSFPIQIEEAEVGGEGEIPATVSLWTKTRPGEGAAAATEATAAASTSRPQMASAVSRNHIAARRAAARAVGSTYVYDYLGLLAWEVQRLWVQYLKGSEMYQYKARHSSSFEAGQRSGSFGQRSSSFVIGDKKDYVELDNLFHVEMLKLPKRVKNYSEMATVNLDVLSDWRVGENVIGMVAFLCTLKTPEYPRGRQIVLIANDITHQGGSFGVEEDIFYAKASEFARHRGIPRIYISSNSGARLGVYEQLKSKISVAFVNPLDPNEGVDYIYLTDADLKTLPPGSVETHQFTRPEGVTVNVVDAIIGTDDDLLGVENLRGSGLIAGETSRAYDEIFTLSYVSGRSVGVGAYVVRLAQRVIQQQNAPIILTGFQALNKLLGRQVFVSQDQLGGPRIMHPNGVSHLVVANDKEGMAEVLKWLTYIPSSVFEKVTVPLLRPPHVALSLSPNSSEAFACLDDVHRDVEVYPPTQQTAFNARDLFTGRAAYPTEDANHGTWLPGFFDTNSFTEYLAGWGKTTIVGRALLGGIPVGVIGVETRTVEARIPADPADADSRETVLSQAGQVWYPDSAYKAAQAIEDFNNGEKLPLFIFANWRGFSGGTRDMYGEVLKFGAKIVDGLRKYKQPVFVYLGPHTELRGGAWVVVDPLINSDKIEMYGDPTTRGGVLEPSGVVEIKFRERDQIALMHRLDDTLKQLDTEEKQQLNGSGQAADFRLNAEGVIQRRQREILPGYHQVALKYADLHDVTGRLVAKGAVRKVVEWRKSRTFFAWRLRRRLAEDSIKDWLRESSDDAQQIVASFDKVYRDHSVDPSNDMEVAKFLADPYGKGAMKELTTRWKVHSARREVQTILEGLTKEELQSLLSQITI